MDYQSINEAEEHEDDEEEEIGIDELEQRMCNDRLHLRKLKHQQQQQKLVKDDDGPNSNSIVKQEQSRRKKMSRAQDSILKYMIKTMEVCNAQGFVYGIIPERGKPVSGSSDNLRAWWKEKVRFDKNAPAAIAEQLLPLTKPGEEISSPEETEDLSLISNYKNHSAVTEEGFGEKRKCEFDQPPKVNLMYKCQYKECPQRDLGFGFVNKNSRSDHESECSYREDRNKYEQEIDEADDLCLPESNLAIYGHRWIDQHRASTSSSTTTPISELEEVLANIRSNGGNLGGQGRVDDLDMEVVFEMQKEEMSQSYSPDEELSPKQEATSIWDMKFVWDLNEELR
ncbi:hypothetical protein BVC80_8855g12 [Macleaya cordata]|uniref:Ethylene insensitive 3-like DNA-binding domain-containing protein n=1 Tax=Macleaya cordata TaxID=56857 RepID=A0A200PY42_MACCD|nr:hypothetical protein BVC80_8855g12 [Macleaya cordata]